MIGILKARFVQGHRTMKYPDGPAPDLPGRFLGRPAVDSSKCVKKCDGKCLATCPTGALAQQRVGQQGVSLDLGRCIFCGACRDACKAGGVVFGRDHALAAAKRSDLVIGSLDAAKRNALCEKARDLFGRSFKLRQVSAGGCNACEADTNVLNTVGWDLGRFGIQFVAAPRHADGILVTGPVSRNMELALKKTYDAVPGPKVVIAVGACAISGGPYAEHPETCSGADGIVPVDLYVPGCPPHPLTILDGLLRFIGRI